MYILDEPSIGLHPKDTQKLMKIITKLKYPQYISSKELWFLLLRLNKTKIPRIKEEICRQYLLKSELKDNGSVTIRRIIKRIIPRVNLEEFLKKYD